MVVAHLPGPGEPVAGYNIDGQLPPVVRFDVAGHILVVLHTVTEVGLTELLRVLITVLHRTIFHITLLLVQVQNTYMSL